MRFDFFPFLSARRSQRESLPVGQTLQRRDSNGALARLSIARRSTKVNLRRALRGGFTFRGTSSLTTLRWLILILGPVPIVMLSWSTSTWFRSGGQAVAARNDGIVGTAAHRDEQSARLPTIAKRAKVRVARDATLQADCDRTAARLRGMAGDEFAVLVYPPFVLGGDMPRATLEGYYRDTIAPAVRAMQARYFRSRPHRPITVLLFSGEESYNRYAAQWYGDSGVSIYGYYKPSERTLLANIATGSGTLLHELTHALFDFEMRDPPVWLNEGLASLHEQCRFRTSAEGPWIEGLVNGRLEGLLTVIRQGRLRSVEALIEDPDFRGPLVGTNYAQARYFCMFLQQRGLLEVFFRDFLDHRADDPDGLEAVRCALDGASWEEIDRAFQKWALSLSP